MSIYISTYYTHDNGTTPFEVTIAGKYVTIHSYYNLCDDIEYNAIEIFIGKSPKNKMTEINETYGDIYDGNSILLYIGENTYVFIGYIIFTFTSSNKIIDFVSPVKNNDSPYPYAIDTNGNIYLLVENVIIINNGDLQSKLIKYDNLYDYYYKYKQIITLSDNVYPLFDDITHFFIDDDLYTLSYQSDPTNYYDNLIHHFGKKIYVKYLGNDIKHELTKNLYVDIMQRYSKLYGFEKITNIHIIHERYF